MGYYTDFSGELTITPGLSPEQTAEVKAFCEKDHRDEIDETGVPGIWCDFDTDGTTLWAKEGKNYDYAEWLTHLVDTFFVPWHQTLNGEIYWDGEETDDRGIMVVTDNQVALRYLQPGVYGAPHPIYAPPAPPTSTTHKDW